MLGPCSLRLTRAHRAFSSARSSCATPASASPSRRGQPLAAPPKAACSETATPQIASSSSPTASTSHAPQPPHGPHAPARMSSQAHHLDTPALGGAATATTSTAAALLALSLLAATSPAHASPTPLLELADLLNPANAKLAESVLRPLFNIFTLLYIVRIPMTWYPSLETDKLPWSVVCAPTEPFLAATRRVVPLVGGVDVTPIVWVGMISFFNEILMGPQGILSLIQREVPL